MYSDDQVPQQSEELWKDCQQLLNDLIKEAPVKTKSLKIPARKTLDFTNGESFYILKDGLLKEYCDDTHLINHEENDLVGLQCLIDVPQTIIETDFAIIVDEYDVSEFLYYIASDKTRLENWNTYLVNLIQSFQLITCDYKKEEVLFSPDIREFKKDQKIIHQGETDNEVYTLINGSAAVMVNDTQVGEIIRDEIFGAIAALTNTVRTADVVATSDCLVMVVPSERFQNLLASRPEMVTKLIEDMARNIISSNEQIVSLSNNE
ncbi:MAG: cyclic nucleotide-binding domain-containing protein [Gammaproteobacteria bacterium]|nr:cyclic nucleotide-binding domain-containing protein [Gammaproteobacteria bacterium]